MDKSIITKPGIALLSFAFCLGLLCLDYSLLKSANNGVSLVLKSLTDAFNTQICSENTATPPIFTSNQTVNPTSEPNNFTLISDARKGKAFPVPKVVDQQQYVDDPCSGKYIYIHHLPSRFNSDVVKDCRTLNMWFDMCPSLSNSGFGPMVRKSGGVFSDRSWFETNQFMLELIFHNRMKEYKCLTSNSSQASAIFVPFYAGLDVGRYLWGFNNSVRDSSAYGMVKWIREKAEWTRLWGRDHFFVAGRIGWDLRRDKYDWGSILMNLPESMNMTQLSIETTSWSNEFAIPYPTYFHPSSDRDIMHWQKRMRSSKRQYLFSFAGAPRPGMNDSIRSEIIKQCLAAKNACKLLNCHSAANQCNSPFEVMKAFADSIFCLQPAGDSYTRRSTFDSILAGCIPVFFHPYSAYAQYTWYFQKNYSKYSVYVPADDIREGRVSINEVLSRFSKDQVLAMRKEVVKLIPKVIYADPRSRLEKFEDAFDIAVKKVLERVEKVWKDVREGKDPSVDFAVENSWKLRLSGIVGNQYANIML